MIHFLHNFTPAPILFSAGAIHIYWYGLFMMLGILAALTVVLILARYYQISRNTIIDLAFWLIIGGLIGARLYDGFLELPYYLKHPGDIFKIWQGGLAIHGALSGGAIVLLIFIKKYAAARSESYWFSFWKFMALITPGVALGQAIGRWGNYFNQELFGAPTILPWGIPIDILNRPINYITAVYFHPAFLYESLGDLFIFIILLTLTAVFIKTRQLKFKNFILITGLYFIFYSLLRFCLEFIRIDYAPTVGGVRWPQIVSALIILFGFILLLLFKRYEKNKTSTQR
jgi:phosphatidylglycerol:prolipoprotein diacylglycerol transferase